MKPLGPSLVSMLLLATTSVDAQQSITIMRRGAPSASAAQPAS